MFKTIIVALDCTDTSDRVLSALDSLSLSANAKAILAHVLSENDGEATLELPHDSRYIVEEKLKTYQSRLKTSSDIEILTGDPAEEIIRLANIHQADLIAIGTRGLKGVKRVIEGSVSAQVVADSPCSVFVIRG